MPGLLPWFSRYQLSQQLLELLSLSIVDHMNYFFHVYHWMNSVVNVMNLMMMFLHVEEISKKVYLTCSSLFYFTWLSHCKLNFLKKIVQPNQVLLSTKYCKASILIIKNTVVEGYCVFAMIRVCIGKCVYCIAKSTKPLQYKMQGCKICKHYWQEGDTMLCLDCYHGSQDISWANSLWSYFC